MASRIANLHAHLAPTAAALPASAEPAAAGILKWVSGLFGADSQAPVAVADRASHPGQTWGHAHPDIVQTAVRRPQRTPPDLRLKHPRPMFPPAR